MDLSYMPIAFLRISNFVDRLGFETGQLDENTSVRYNWKRGTTYLDALAAHADANGGRLLFPFTSNASVKRLSVCGRFIIHTPYNRKYLIGDIHSVGGPYRPGMDDEDGYTTPPQIRYDTETRWVKLDAVTRHDEFDPSRYVNYDYKTGKRRLLSDILGNSRMSLMFIVEREDD